MVDDIRHPDQKPRRGQNKQVKQTAQTFIRPAPVQAVPASVKPPLEAPHLYVKEEGFVPAEAIQKIKEHRWPHLIFKHATKKERVIGSVLAVVILIGGGAGVYGINKSFNNRTDNVATPIAQKVDPPPQPTTEASRLTGVQIPPELNKRPVTGIMIENSPDARPQSGVKDAGIVFEAIAEGGITRFLTLFQESQPDYIGPVRSVRPYYVDLLLPFDAALAHAGGSAEGLAKVRALGVKDLDHGANAGAFRRVPDRYAPHNLYTSTAGLDAASAARGFTTSNFKSFPRKAEKPAAQVTARTIDIAMSSYLYNVRYDYNPASNSYDRSQGGRPHTDQRSGQQLSPKTVVALVMGYSQKGIYSVYQTTGTGKMYVFQDGTVQSGSWSKAGEREQFEFKDDGGNPLTLNAGQTWFTLVKTPGNVSSAP